MLNIIPENLTPKRADLQLPTEIKNLYASKLLLENLQNEFSPQTIRDTLVALTDPTHSIFMQKKYDYIGVTFKNLGDSLRTDMLLSNSISKKLRDKVYNSLSKFAEIHRRTTQVFKIGVDNNFRSYFSQFNQLSNNQDDHTIIKKLNSLRDDDGDLVSILHQEFYQYKESNDNCSILSMLTQIRKKHRF
ncbi:unnamed protein product [Rhizophagus irregularis]|nr:unnamed protein product [Rhizophagus irregularis]